MHTSVILYRRCVANCALTCNVLTLYSPLSVTLQPNSRNYRHNLTFTALYVANNLTGNWPEAYSMRSSCLSENNTKQALKALWRALILQAQLTFHCDVVLVLFTPKIQNFHWVNTVYLATLNWNDKTVGLPSSGRQPTAEQQKRYRAHVQGSVYYVTAKK